MHPTSPILLGLACQSLGQASSCSLVPGLAHVCPRYMRETPTHPSSRGPPSQQDAGKILHKVPGPGPETLEQGLGLLRCPWALVLLRPPCPAPVGTTPPSLTLPEALSTLPAGFL